MTENSTYDRIRENEKAIRRELISHEDVDEKSACRIIYN